MKIGGRRRTGLQLATMNLHIHGTSEQLSSRAETIVANQGITFLSYTFRLLLFLQNIYSTFLQTYDKHNAHFLDIGSTESVNPRGCCTQICMVHILHFH